MYVYVYIYFNARTDSMYTGIISPNDLQVEMNALRAYFPSSSSSSPFCSHVKTIKFEDINTTAFKQYHHHHPINNWFAHSKHRATSIYLSISKTNNRFPCILQLKNNINHTQMIYILQKQLGFFKSRPHRTRLVFSIEL